MKMRSILVGLLGLITTLILASCSQKNNEVVVYSSIDQIFSEPILRDFEKQSGIKVKMVFDTEETKSTGVMNRLIAEKENPQCDLFWSGDPMRNILLKSKGVTTPYQSKATLDIPQFAQDKEGHWIGFSARARVLLYNKRLIAEETLPQSILDLTQPKYNHKLAIANPLFGTTTFHIAAIFSTLGIDKGMAWLDGLRRNNITIATSNGDVKHRVITGEVAFGLTDTDDAFEAKKESSKVDFIFLDQEKNGLGTLIIPNALSLIAHSPNPENGKKLMEYLLSKEVEAKLSLSCAQMPLIKGTNPSSELPNLGHIVPMNIDYEKSSKILTQMQGRLQLWLEQ